MKNRQGRRIVFIAFSGEERGLLRLDPLLQGAAVPARQDRRDDQHGHDRPHQAGPGRLARHLGKKDRLVVYGTGTGDGFERTGRGHRRARVDFKLSTLAAGTGPSDHDSFYRKKIPVLFLYTGTHGEYHRPTDVPEKINVAGDEEGGRLRAEVRRQPDHARDPAEVPVDARPVERPAPNRASRPARAATRHPPGNYESEDGGVLVGGRLARRRGREGRA